ncbi:hypothetical protein MARPO_0166s0014 [Marchantia polymorpha]|uniref:Pentacotripeptide-repeat region of PRORP domain-containing protein n=1 Tax=Marchantia polymorpha TaxID=3197 RepID=A0A2R6W3D4_MARPO|nr:hypothetical protein MARPO_0166s0014 [Marchantia polymorpha]|eukprot:PTQ28357.1 hypothetical protein MARPO_0166s0014 [Marchantia polymorpha]
MDKWAWKLQKGALSRTVKDLGRMQLTEKVLPIFLWLQRQPHLWPDEITLCAAIHVMVEAGEIGVAMQLHRVKILARAEEGAMDALGRNLGLCLSTSVSSSTKRIRSVSEFSGEASVDFKKFVLGLRERDVVCYGSGRPDRRGRRDLPYIRKISRDRQKERERREAGIAEEEDDAFEESDELRSGGEKIGKLPIESNGPPLLILHPYISDEKPVDERFLRPLPLPSPHKLRPLRLPKPSLRRKVRIAVSTRDRVQSFDFLKDLASEIRSQPDDEPLSELMDKWAWKLQKGALSRTVKDLGRMQLTEKVLPIFLWLQRQPHLWPDEITLCAAIHVMVEAGEIGVAMQLHRGVGQDSIRAAQTLASALAKCGRLEEAMEVAKNLLDSGRKVDASVYRTITEWACRTGSRNLVTRLWQNVNLSNLNFKLQDYTSLMASCSKLGLYEIIDRLYQDFLDSGLEPNIVMYTTLLSVLSREGRYREAVALIWEMEEVGCEPDLMAYEVMLDVCAKLEDLNRAMKVYKDLKNAGYIPTPDFYNTLIQLFVKKGSLSRAKDMTREMSSRGYTPSAETLSYLSAAAA